MRTNTSQQGSSVVGLVVGTLLSATVLLTHGESGTSQERKPSSTVPAQKDPAVAAGPSLSIASSLESLRQAVAAELAKVPASDEELKIDVSGLIVHNGGPDRLVAGAPVQRSGARLSPAREDGEQASSGDDERVVGTVVLLGVLDPWPAEPTDSGLSDTTYLVRRESPAASEVAIVSTKGEVVAVVPLIGPPSSAPAWTTDHVRVGEDENEAPVCTFGESEWSRIYMSILHYFESDVG
jgi:hypothetical protein